MPCLSQVGRLAAADKNGRSAAAPKNDRASLCSFTFSGGRRCRTPPNGKHPHLCFYHAQKEARARTAEKLGKDLAYFFSGDYLSACDLSTALARFIPAVVRGDVKPRTARTVPTWPKLSWRPSTSPRTIHHRLWHGRLAQIRPQLRQRQPQLPLPARPPTRTPTVHAF